MKIVDEKGRLFGKVNLIDLLVLLLVIAAAAALIWKTAGKKAAEHAAKPLRATYTVLCDAVITECRAEPSSPDASDGAQDLYITIDAAATTANNVYKVASQEIRTGYEYNVKTPYFELPGVICAMEVENG